MKDENIKEDFCAPCLLAVPAILGVGGAASSSAAKNKLTKKILLIGGIILTIVSIIIFVYSKSKCQTCR